MARPVTLQLASDLFLDECDGRPLDQHLERLLVPTGQVLAMCGNVCAADHPALQQLLQWCSRRWDFVLFVPGPREFCTRSMLTIVEASKILEDVCEQFQNVILLRNRVVFVEEHMFVGSTLWAHIPEDKAAQARFGLSCYCSALLHTRMDHVNKTHLLNLLPTGRDSEA